MGRRRTQHGWCRARDLAVLFGIACACVLPPGAAAKNISGTPRSDVLVGTRRADTIRGRGGDDRIYGKRGNDRLFGGAGNDRLVGGRGRDSYSCGRGRDVVLAERGEHVARDCETVHWVGPPPSPPPPPPPGALPYRYVLDQGSDTAATSALGWNLADVGGKWAADQLPPGVEGVVWVGDYDNGTCGWQVSDSDLTAEVQSMVGDPKVFGFFFSDEPYAEDCPQAPAQHATRNALIKSIDPSTTTLIALNANGEGTRSYWPLWSTPTDADVIAIDPYPCMIDHACDWSLVTDSILAADVVGFNYWFVVESFQNYEYRYPTADELQHLLGLMEQSNAQGLMTFAWDYDGHCLCGHPDLLSVWNAYNHS